MEALLKDLRFTTRSLLRRPGFTAVAVLTLALGIGATTAIFSVVDGVLLRPLPYPEPEEVMQIRQVNEGGGTGITISFPNYADLRERSRGFEAMGAYGVGTATVSAGGDAVRVPLAAVTAGFFDVLGVEPAVGRTFLPDELGVPGSGVVVVGHRYWRTRLGGDPDLSDAVVRMGSATLRVVGVMPSEFSFPKGVQLWYPSPASLANESRSAHNFRVIGRLSEDATLERARTELSAIARRLKARYGDNTQMFDAAVIPLREQLVGGVKPPLLILLGAAGFLLLIACANVVNLLLARMASRRRELSIRMALGAGRRRLAARFLTEGFVLALAGGALGVLLAVWGVPALLALEPSGLPRLDEVGVNWTVLAFALIVSVLAAAALGLVPALRAAGGDVRGSLADGRRTQTGGASSHRVRRVLVASQVALTLVLLVGAGLLGRSFLRVISVDPGFRTDGPAVVMDMWLPYSGGEAAEARVGGFHDALLARIRALPGVEEAGGVSTFPLSGGGVGGTFAILNSRDVIADFEGISSWQQLRQHPALLERIGRMFRDETRTGHAQFRIASDGYFGAMGIPLIRGRLFNEGDAPNAPHVALISQSLAEAEWPGENPIGKIIEFGNMDSDLRPFTVVGVVGDIRERSLETRPQPTFYGYTRQRPGSTFRYHVIMRGAGDPAATIAAARGIVHELNPGVALRFRTLEQVLSASLSERQFTLVLLGVFGAAALLLAVLGIYGVVSYMASQRRREVGIRMALGARAGDVLRLVIRQGAALALVGVALGVAVALGLTRLLSGLLYGVEALDPLTFGAAALLLACVALVASYVPARRATKVDPTTALRAE